jgi:ABC-2 type transport system ATP-binding protein
MNIEIRHLCKSFGVTRAVDDISFSFAGGQIMGFVGPNGAGKTTTMRILATLEEPSSGDILIDGISIIEEPEKARERVGFVPDNLVVHQDITVEDYLDFFARTYGLKGKRRREVIDSIEDFTNLKGIRDKFLVALSKGMKQRVSLARALLPDPPVLVMDEPAAGLDPRARIELRELLKVLAGQGKAILISSHILTELSEICSGAAIIEQGKLLRAGSLQDILTSESTRRIILIRPAERGEELLRDLLQTPQVEAGRLIGEEIELEVAGGDRFCGELLTGIIQKGFLILEFRQKRTDLETVFMTITKGEVQ